MNKITYNELLKRLNISKPPKIFYIKDTGYSYGNNNHEKSLQSICELAVLGFSPVFEFGTFLGLTAASLALNQISVTTIGVSSLEFPQPVGILLRNINGKVKLIEMDSTADSFKWQMNDFTEQFGMVFIDGGHDFETCMSDSLLAFELARKVNPLILWHDYTDAWPGVKKCVDEINKTRKLYYIPDLELVAWLGESTSCLK